MNIETIRLLLDYNWWTHHKIWDECVLPLSEDQFTRDLGYSLGSVHGQMVHSMSAEWLYLSRFQGHSPKAMFNNEDYPTRPMIRARWDEIEEDFRAFLATLDDAKLGESFSYTNTKGVTFTNTLLEGLLQVINHGTDHRAQVLALIHQVGGKTMEQDFIRYLRR